MRNLDEVGKMREDEEAVQGMKKTQANSYSADGSSPRPVSK